MAQSFDPGRIVRELTGATVSLASGRARCTRCGTVVTVGDEVTVYAYRVPSARTFRVARVYCPACQYRAVRHPTLGALETVVEGTVTGAADRLVLSQVAVLDWSEAADGSAAV